VGDAISVGKRDAVERRHKASANDGLLGNPAVTTDSNEHNIIDSYDFREPAPTTAVQHDEASVLFSEPRTGPRLLTWKEGRFVNKVAVTSVILQREMMVEELSRKTKNLQKIKAWRIKNIPLEERVDDKIDLDILLRVRSLKLATTSQRTYYLTTIAEFAWEKNRWLDETPRLKKKKAILKMECAGHITNRAKTIGETDLPSLFSGVMLGVAEVLLLLYARVGNAQGFRTLAVKDEENHMIVRVFWFKHKTCPQLQEQEK
jgi:hypothetical protein